MEQILLQAGLLLIRFLNIYYWLIFVYILSSWILPLRTSRVFYYLAMIVEPYLSVFRRIIPPIAGFDFSPVLAIIALNIATNGFVNFLSNII